MTPRQHRALAARIRQAVRRRRADLVDFTSAMVRVPSENPPGKVYTKAARLIAAHLKTLGLAPRTLDPTGEGPCVVATYGDAGRALYFSGHYDVVPAQDRAQFEPVVKKGNLHGRGTADMKGGIAVMAYAIHALMDLGFEPKGRIVSVSVPDEETSGPRGTVALSRAGFIERDAIGMLTAEPTSGVVWNANRGVITLRVTVRGRPAHVGLHFRGVNAFRGMLEVAGMLAALEAEVSQRCTAFTIAPEAARRSLMLIGGELSGGHNFNVVPDEVAFTLDRRTNPEEDFAAERARLFEVIDGARARGHRVTVDVLQEGVAAATDARGPLARALGAGIRAATGRAARFELCPGVLETRHYATLGVPALAYGPGLLSVSHGPHEFVAIERMLQCTEAYALAAVRLLG